ncbi:non-specific lipid transfer protein GPI-anchored 1-like [Telopea speciosissima]|uniref:non-specific lipid transfer protein GPI-anchored 1-like n=1 Tax=Telopea speciosissima TaxID=54955 RepID=UPI001CC3872A|nr:non-specific lipid transfer protein GPI-anchored 1-like [Telopea speciosissima]XP_043725269.1 non-specific lipid transfer protein GPI-anchored 1-like [Telopea speciosissima]
MMKTTTLLLSFLLVFSVFQIQPSSSASVEQECSNQISKVTPCLNYATGKASSPTDQCCSAVSDIKTHNPVCLCYVIQQTHDGVASIKQIGLQEAKLLQLPTACKLANASFSDCPKLLNLSANSPDAAIFTNSSSAATSNATATASENSNSNSNSNGLKHGTQVAGPIAITIAVAVFISVFPTGLSSLLLCAGA